MKVQLAWLVLLATASVAAQTPTPVPTMATGLIVGRVVDATSGKPLAEVTVSLGGPPAPGGSSPRVLTSGDGYFVFSGLPRGAYGINASKSGYVPGAHGKQQPAGSAQTLDLAEGERRSDVTIPMWRYAAIGGTVVDESGEPLVGIPVRVLRRSIIGGAPRLTQAGNPATTDDRGIYRASQLVPGDYVAAIVTTITAVPTAVQDAYGDAMATGAITPYQAGRDAGAGSALSLSGGVRFGDLLLKPGTGGFNGQPLEAPRIAPLRADGRLFVYPTLYYPAEPTATQATIITLASGEERSNVDFQQRPVPSMRVSGTILGPDGPSSNTEISLYASGTDAIAREQTFESATAVSDTAGRFTLAGVTPGDYTLKVLRAPARPIASSLGQNSITVQVGGSTITSVTVGPPPPIPMVPTLSSAVAISANDRDVTGVVVTLREGARLSGHVEFNGSATRPTADQLRRANISIDPADGRLTGPTAVSQIWQGQLDADGQLTSYQLPPGRYVIRPGPLVGWKFADVTLDGKDVTDAPFELGTADISRFVITYTDRQADLSGTVRDDAHAPSAAADVVLFPADDRAWTGYGQSSRRIRSTSPAKDGRFTFAAVPPGDYLLTAIPSGSAPDWQDPATLRRLVSVAVPVTIADGEKKAQDLVIKPVRQK